MPTLRKTNYYNQPKPSVQEIKLSTHSTKSNTNVREELVKKRSTTTKPSKRATKSPYEVCDSTQNLLKDRSDIGTADKRTDQTKPYIHVPIIQLRLSEEESQTSTPPPKQRGYDFTSSTNSHFDGWLVAAPKKFKRTCSSTPTSSKRKSSTLSIQTTPLPKLSDENLVTSQEMVDTQHKASGAKRMVFRGPEWKKPCRESVVAGAPKPFIGACPLNFEEFAKLSRTRQKFFLTQDPRKKYCLVNPQALRTKAFSEKREFNILTKTVKYADNVCGETQSQSSESFICDQIDLENPMQLDFQGLDYRKTYQADEQDIQNQSLYRSIMRYMERRRVKQETQDKVEEELQNERLAVPQCFDVPDRTQHEDVPSSEPPVPFCKLFRSADKPYNQQKIEEENRNRRNRYKNLYLERKDLAEEADRAREAQHKINEELKPTMLAMKHFTEVLNSINAACDPQIKIEALQRKPPKPATTYPHTMRETKQFKKKLKAQNRIKRDNALVKKEFYLANFGKLKDYPEAKIELSSDTPRHVSESPELSEQSSDDEDDIEVGKHGSNYQLRGFHFKLGKSLRGKRHQREKTGGTRKEKTCKTREDWLAELVQKKDVVKMDIEEGIPKLRGPDDPLLKIFQPQFGYKLPQIKSSAVREFIEKRLGRHYDRDLRKKFKMVRPRLEYPMKKFNLIHFLYTDHVQDLSNFKAQHAILDKTELMKLNTTLEYMAAKENIKKQKMAKIKEKRLKLLGIPCHEVKKSSLQTKCEQSDTGTDSEWVPTPEPELVDQEEENRRARLAKSVALPLAMRGNMPAPKHRETTIRRHPRKPRDYFGERVPSQLFDKTVAEVHKPHLLKLKTDDVHFSNLREVPNREYSKIFEARHHHDHWNHMQQKLVDVHYQPKIVKAEATKGKSKEDHVLMENFRMAQPPCNQYVGMDLTIAKCDTKALLADYMQNTRKQFTTDKTLRIKDLCQSKDVYFHSRPRSEIETLNFPGRKEYLDFLHEVRKALYETKVSEEQGQKLTVDREEIIQDIEEDLKSIESCLTSLSSSVCTNLSNDSGSFLLMEGKTKIPLDYIRKSVVPFEPMNRCRFKLEPLDIEAEENNPFKVLPFTGQGKAQNELNAAKDSFFTFNTRLQNGLRLRLEVPVEDVRQKLIGRGPHKYRSVVTTDIDENYVDELKNRPPVKMFSFKTGSSFIKDALRLKFESMLIQGQIVRTKIYDRLNEHHWENMMRLKLLYEKLFAKWEKREYESAMSVVHKVKTYYDRTDALKREFRELERQQIVLNMDIVFIEGHWIRRIMLQNFHYLLGDSEWRYENDWIHRIEKISQRGSECEEDEDYGEEEEEGEEGEGCTKTTIELENFEESIMKRNTVNIRKRDKDDAWAIKSYYEDVYMKNLHPILIVFPNADSFMRGIENLKIKTFVLLLEMHFTLSIHTELQSRLETFEVWCLEDLREKQSYVSRKCAKLYFMSDRATDMKLRTLDFLSEPVESSFNDEAFIKHRAVIIEVWREIVPENMRSGGGDDLEPLEMVAMISEVAMELISKFESIPVDESRRIEAQLRRRRAYDRKISRQAYLVEKRIESEMKKVRRNLEPPYVKPKRKGKLPRIIIKKKEKKISFKEQRVTEHTKFFFRAFHDEGDVMQLHDARDSIGVMDTIQEQIVPFYFDHFLKLNGYTPNYNFKTNVELRDGPEASRVALRSLVPEILEKLDKWELVRKRIMDDNIQRNPRMYENVQF
ncbi:PREDICTED: uncharacterized protein LOC108966810 [Bactrocera latifrons]|uniref:Uncharacterized protein n=1 Tax=Bactrocera latifrons TaxID=174628 RepID=A0A0K8UQ82_BACLA|nr:PREDICTED: uncharacterized protein LOC108966810 [Bactrocera latifrons]